MSYHNLIFIPSKLVDLGADIEVVIINFTLKSLKRSLEVVCWMQTHESKPMCTMEALFL